MDSLPPIPTPSVQRWREFRIRVLPVFVFLSVIAAIVVLWRNYVQPTSIVGMVEPNTIVVSTFVPGKLVGLTVKRFQRVKAGDVLGQVITTDPKVVEASLGVIRAQIALIRSGLAPAVGSTRADFDYLQLRLNFMREKVSQASDRNELVLAQENFERQDKLFKFQVISSKQFEEVKTVRERLLSAIAERESYLAKLEQDLKRLGQGASGEDPIQAAVLVQEQELKLTEAKMTPQVLTAPVDGLVGGMNHASGENVVAGEPILTINAPPGDRIVGFIRQPLNVPPQVGTPVEVHSRSAKRLSGSGRILEVGNQLELIYTNLLINPSVRSEMGLPILVSLPPGLKLIPGEIVDLSLGSSPK